ncbi:ABC transporter permease [Pacificitalea manganoxidans]|uniref:ABC transporter permease n=1 Tax=Pacificitalea manganoxidans TaxID=1411902 RepID=UPI0018E0A47A|nr:ABC transporter permease [Pacificitalea manganoxidans]MDR6308480.1 putative spermidine/putrescine transport system permease protein [Pacificitalea manganoxidans]|tara:strand:- start:1585 stop:3222 length:1638 start_codon:yes stop_codon:yes gene_type:complete
MADAIQGNTGKTGPTPDDGLRIAENEDADGRMIAADGTPLKRSLQRSLRRQKIRALLLIAPLLIFVLVTFIAPIADMLFRSVENDIVAETLPRTVAALDEWDYQQGGDAPDEDVFAAFYYDLVVAAEAKTHTRLGSRLNYETTGISSLFRKSGRRADRLDTDIYTEQFTALDPAWESPATWIALTDALADGRAETLPETQSAWQGFARIVELDGDDIAEEQPWDFVYTALYRDLAANGAPGNLDGATGALVTAAAQAVPEFETVSIRDQFVDVDDDWLDPEVWGTIKAYSGEFTPGYFLNSVDYQLTPAGVEPQPDDQAIYILLFKRTLFMSLMITVSCIALGYPVAWLLANIKARHANLLLILVLLPFWTSLLVRTSAWKILLQQQGVINDILVWIGIIGDGNRLVMINNQFGTIVAMTHILLPFMILPLYSVMQTIPPTYLRAAKSLGATNSYAFWKVYFPLSVPGIGAGSILVFILAIGYYITPELVGGTTGTFISNRIAYHISSSLNWGLAAALGSILLAVVMILYWAYDRIVGIDNVKLG